MNDLPVFIRWLLMPPWVPRPVYMRWYSDYLRTDHWCTFSRWHRRVWTLRGGRCDVCGRARAEQVHHLPGAYAWCWLEWLVPWKFRNLCASCHYRTHAK